MQATSSSNQEYENGLLQVIFFRYWFNKTATAITGQSTLNFVFRSLNCNALERGLYSSLFNDKKVRCVLVSECRHGLENETRE